MVNTNIENKMTPVLKFMFMKGNSFLLKCCFSCNKLWIKGCYLQLLGYFVGRCRMDLFKDVTACLWRKLGWGGGAFWNVWIAVFVHKHTVTSCEKKNTILWA